MANISNIFASIIAFVIGLIMLFTVNPIINFILDLFDEDSGLIKIIMATSWLLMSILIGVYYPIHILTSDDKMDNNVQ